MTSSNMRRWPLISCVILVVLLACSVEPAAAQVGTSRQVSRMAVSQASLVTAEAIAIDVDTLPRQRRFRGTGADMNAVIYVKPVGHNDCLDGGRDCGFSYYVKVSPRINNVEPSFWFLGEFGPMEDASLFRAEGGELEVDIGTWRFFPRDHANNRLADPTGFRVSITAERVRVIILD